MSKLFAAIAALDSKARELLELANDLEESLDALPTETLLPKIDAFLSKACAALGEVELIFNGNDSPLDELVRRIDGAVVAAASSRLNEFLNDHAQMLKRIGVSQKTIDKTLQLLESTMKSDSDLSLDHPATLERDSDDKRLALALEELHEFRKFVCALQASTQQLREVLDVRPIKACVQGVAGVCLVVVDTTGALTVPDPTAWVYVKAVKSVWSGFKLMRKAFEAAKDSFHSWQSALKAEKDQQILKGKKSPRL